MKVLDGGSILHKGRIADPHTARKGYLCSHCFETILPGERYYSVVIAGGGLGSIKFPERVHPSCIVAFLEGKRGIGE